MAIENRGAISYGVNAMSQSISVTPKIKAHYVFGQIL